MNDLEAEFAKERWFHSIDFGDFASSGRFKPGTPQNVTLYGFMDLIKHIDLTDKNVLDIGATDGLASFGMAALGAKVHATDSVDKQTFRRVRDVLGHNVEYYPKTQIKEFSRIFRPGQFDLILCAGVFYHMLNPASSVFECRKLLKHGGLLLMETPFYPKEERAAIFINSETQTVQEVNTYSVPTISAVTGLMKLAGLEILASRTICPQNRITVLGKAVHPEQVSNKTPLLKRIHEVDFCDHEFRFADEPNKPCSNIEYLGERNDATIDTRAYTPDFPYHPPMSKRTVGTTMWTSVTGNH